MILNPGEPEDVEFTIQQPQVAEVYRNVCGLIDQHNRIRHDDVKFEKNVEVNGWDKRVNLSIFVVDTFKVLTALISEESINNFIIYLSEVLIGEAIHLESPETPQVL